MTARLSAALALAFGLSAGLALPPAPARAQEIPAPTERDLWCGLAFVIIADEAPADASAEQKALAERYAEGGAMLTERARGVYLEAGYSEDRLATLVGRLHGDVADEINRAGAPPTYSYEECRVLLPF